jgi:hypothetical protein
MVPAAHKVLTFKRADGTEFKANPSTDEARAEFKTRFWGTASEPIPTEMDPPMVWLPMKSTIVGRRSLGSFGTEVGPACRQNAASQLRHCILYNVLQEQVGDVAQGAVVKLAGKFPSGIMRGRFSQKTANVRHGLNVWQSDAARFGCLDRVRYTGNPSRSLSESRLPRVALRSPSRVRSTRFGHRPENWSVERWNYKWTGQYGSTTTPSPNRANAARAATSF